LVTAVLILLHSWYVGAKVSQKPAALLLTLSRMEQIRDAYILLRNSERESQFVIILAINQLNAQNLLL